MRTLGAAGLTDSNVPAWQVIQPSPCGIWANHVTTYDFAIFAKSLFALALLVNATEASAQTPPTEKDKIRLERFEKEVDDLRNRLRIPGFSAVVVKDQQVLWAKGYGFADIENRIPATPDTLYSIASLTKTFAATLIMRLVEQGKLDLDEPVSHYSSDFKDESVRIKHLLSHTSSGTPGERFQYDGNRFDYLTAVIEKKTGKSIVNVVVETFLDPLGMSDSVPYHSVVNDADKWLASLGKDRVDRYRKNLTRLAQPYTYYGAGETVHTTYPLDDALGAAAGLLSTVRDLAKYDIAIDRHVFLTKETQEKAWTPFVSNGGERLPYGLGWFVTDWHGLKLVWHYGHWGTGFAAMYLKIPERNVSIVMLANSEALADHSYEEVTNVFVCTFLDLWGYAYDCERNSQAALAKWVEQRRAQGRVAMPVHPDILESYVGQYQFETLDNRIFTITRGVDRLFVKSTQGPSMELFAESESTFFVKIRPYLFVFTRSEGNLPQLEIVDGDETFHSKRIK
jgi:CubicO group peptidase (beta-lactamase class C family)